MLAEDFSSDQINTFYDEIVSVLITAFMSLPGNKI